MLLWPWLIFALFLLFLVALDLGLLTRKPRELSPTESLLSVFLWLAAAGVASLAVFRLYQNDLWGVRESLGHAIDPGAAWVQFITAYLTEMALSVDNVAIIAVIFAQFRLRPELRARMLMWVVVVCLALRAVLIGVGAELLRIHWMKYAFAAALFIGALREFLIPKPDADVGDKLLIRLTRRLPTTPVDQGQALFARQPLPDGSGRTRWVFTPLMMVFVAAAAADVSFALDSLPAVFTVTRDPLIAFTSNALAILSLRSLYFVLSPLIDRFRYMKISLSLILLYLGVAMILPHEQRLATEITLGVVALILALGVGVSVVHQRFAPAAALAPRPTPLRDLTEGVAIARRNLWKVGILIGGTSVIIFGILIAPLPGPGPTVLVPMGLVILASEFVWAQRLLKIFQEKSLQLAEHGDRVGELFPKWVLMPIVLAYYGLFSVLLINTEHPKLRVFINATCFGLSFPFLAWVVRTAKMNLGPLNRFIYAKRADSKPASTPPSAERAPSSHHKP